MINDDDDAIAAWAEQLTPEGAPGEMSTMMRKVLGDAGYEKMVADHEIITNLHITRQFLINKILTLVCALGVVFFFMGSIAAGGLLVLLFTRNFF